MTLCSTTMSSDALERELRGVSLTTGRPIHVAMAWPHGFGLACHYTPILCYWFHPVDLLPVKASSSLHLSSASWLMMKCRLRKRTLATTTCTCRQTRTTVYGEASPRSARVHVRAIKPGNPLFSLADLSVSWSLIGCSRVGHVVRKCSRVLFNILRRKVGVKVLQEYKAISWSDVLHSCEDPTCVCG